MSVQLDDERVSVGKEQSGLETWFIRGGSAATALYTFLRPGIHVYVTHNLIEAVELGVTAWRMQMATYNRPVRRAYQPAVSVVTI